MASTTVSGTILGVDNAVQVGVYVYFRLKSTGTDSVATSTIDASRISALTDANGQFTVTLWDNGDSGVTSILEIEMPSKQRHEVIIPAGDAAIDVWDLIENYTVGTADPQLPTNETLFMRKANDLSDVASASTSRTNLGVAIGVDVASNAQGTLADSAVQPADDANTLGSGAATNGYVLAANGAGATSWVAVGAGSGDMVSTNNLSDVANAATSRTNLGVAIGTDVQAQSAVLQATTASFLTADETKLDGIEALADVTDATNVAAAGAYVSGGTDVLVGDGGTGASTASAARTNLGLAIGSDVQAHAAVLDATTALADVTDATNVVAAGAYVAGGTDVAVLDGGTGASTESAARTSLGLEIGVNVEAFDATILKDADIGSTVQAYDVILDTIETTITDTDTAIPTSGAVVDYVASSSGNSDALIVAATVSETSGIVAGQVVYISGAATGLPLVSLADNTDFTKADVIAVATESAADAAAITVMIAGTLNNVDTSTFTAGQILYLGTTGDLTTTHPTGINAVQRIGHAVEINAITGSILVELDQLSVINDHDGIMRFQVVNQNAGTSASSAFTMVNDADHRSSLSMVGSGYTAVAGIAESMVIYNEGYNKTVNAVDGNFGFEWWTDTTDSHNLSSTSKMELSAGGDFAVHGTGCFDHTAIEADDHALEISCDAAGFGDVKGIEVNYITGAIGPGTDEGVILVNIDESLSTGGEVFALEVLTTTTGGDAVIGMKTGVGIDPISQDSGIFENIDTILNKTVDVTAALAIGGAGNITIFAADNDTITVGHASNFDELEVLFDTGASQNVNPTWEYSTGVGTWATFTPTDGTNGFQNSGAMLWDSGDLAGWIVGTGSEFLIRITRTRNSLTTAPIVDVIQLAEPEVFSWDKNGDVTVNKLRATSLPAYQDEAAAVVAGLATGQMYQTSGTGAGALYGEVGVVMIKQ